MEKTNLEEIEKLIGKSYKDIGNENLQSLSNKLKTILTQRKMPEIGWNDIQIERLILELSNMDTNNFDGKSGVGEREGRVYSSIVAKRNYYLGHGIGRSGTVNAVQPKAPGSSLILILTRFLFLDAIKRCCSIQFAKDCLILPTATGMAISLSFLTLKSMRPKARYVIWPRIDQKTCFKAILTAGLEPLVIENLIEGDALTTDTDKIKQVIEEVGAENVLCVLSTTSCFAPRVPDNIPEISKICKENDIFHVVNNAYGLQCTKISNMLNIGHSKGRLDLVI